jgi:hypothetical protein
MKKLGLSVLLLSALSYNAPGYAEDVFHNGGTGRCNGCHTTPPELIGSDASSTCLICHQAPLGMTLPSRYYIATDARSFTVCEQLPPGGDFCWLKKSYKWSSPGHEYLSQGTSPGERHGHNIVALDYGYEADNTLHMAPGGTYLSTSLSCISCHDPHGSYRRNADGSITREGLPIVASGSFPDSPDPSSTATVGTYRLLAGKGYQPKSLPGVPVFTADPPAAVAPRSSNRPETSSDTRVAYGSGMSEWCRNCHPRTSGDYTHPAGNDAVLPPDMVGNYNSYISSGNLAGRSDTAYTSLVPFELRTKDYSVLKRVANIDNSVRTGPTGGANVMCLSCHRAHASGWDGAMRWNMASDFIVHNGLYPGTDNSVPAIYSQGRLSAETQKAYYDRSAAKFGTFQRSLCNRCHVKD